ncbi:hypothetical protein E2562_029850 [Oryza meyeriana var. granulata]|uniref:U2A'/phosphoprotein 32 family A C-terminal domain-containing protein n=1 Tax=Oryza meyeriana var. granulata TaxID=110450 RepID=A0A6G1ER90_9ORYZ|nr:hypothetical protein E2562_029850 [Oryza meyeriana var. granulata]
MEKLFDFDDNNDKGEDFVIDSHDEKNCMGGQGGCTSNRCTRKVTDSVSLPLPSAGLSSCPFLKELYIGGNKISEVEGLHRLKLKVLDLHSNKLSSSKCLDQLANCSTLQSIVLEGNPAQKHVGDEQLKRHVLSLLPHLVYYNKQAVRSSRRCSKPQVAGGRQGRAVDRGGGGRSKRPLDLKLPRRSACVSVAMKSSGCHHVRAGAAAASHGSVRPSRQSRNAPPLAAIHGADHPSEGERRLPGTEISSEIFRIRSVDGLC